MSEIPITPREVAEAVTSDDFQEVLKNYSFVAGEAQISFQRLYGGIRNAVFVVETKGGRYVLTIYKPSLTARDRVERSLLIYRYLKPRGFPVPEVMPTKENRLYLRRKLLGTERFVSCHRFIGGRRFFPYGKGQIVAAARMQAKLHTELADFPEKEILLPLGEEGKKTGLHMDFARGNVLFSEGGEDVCAVLDFEEAAWGAPVFDIAKSLAIISKDNRELSYEEIRNCYLENYQAVGGEISGRGRLDDLVGKYKAVVV